MIAIMSTVDGVAGTDKVFHDFGDDAIVLDGWAEDWWFPNVGKLDTVSNNLWRAGTPFALKVRVSSKRCNELDVKSKIC